MQKSLGKVGPVLVWSLHHRDAPVGVGSPHLRPDRVQVTGDEVRQEAFLADVGDPVGPSVDQKAEACLFPQFVQLGGVSDLCVEDDQGEPGSNGESQSSGLSGLYR